MPQKCSKLNSEGGDRIDRVELAYMPLPEVVAHVFNAKIWYLCPDLYAVYRVNQNHPNPVVYSLVPFNTYDINYI